MKLAEEAAEGVEFVGGALDVLVKTDVMVDVVRKVLVSVEEPLVTVFVAGQIVVYSVVYRVV